MSLGEFISAILEHLPVGFGFRPTDEELVDHYLNLKIQGMGSHVDIIPVIDVCKKEPWQLPDLSVIKTSDPDWFFFNPVDYKYSNGNHVNRQTETGFWKPTGQDREIKSGNNKIGTKKTLVFHKGRGRAAERTNWVIHEYRADIASFPTDKAYVLCHLKKKPEENTGSSDIPVHGEAVAGHGNGLANNMPSGVGPSLLASNIVSDIGNYQVDEMVLDEDPELQGLLHETTIPSLDHEFFDHREQGCDFDFSTPSGFNGSYGSVQFLDGDDAEFADNLFIDSDGYPCQTSSAVNRLSARPQSPLRGAYGKGERSSSDTDAKVLHVKDSVSRPASSYVVSGSKECMQPPMAQQKHATSGLSNINQPKREKSVAQEVAAKSVKLEGNDSNYETLQAKLVRLSCDMKKLGENSVSVKAKDRAEYGSATHLPQNNNPIRESKKETEVSHKANPKLSSMTKSNELVGNDQKGSPSSREISSANHESSPSPAQLVNLLVGMIMLVSFIIVMMLDMVAKF